MANGGGKGKVIVFFGISLIAGVVVAFIIYQLLGHYQNRLAEAEQPEETTSVVIAARDLYMGVMITEQDVSDIEIPPRFLQADEDMILTSQEQVVGRMPRERILANEFIRKERLADLATGQGLNAIVPRGMRAMSIDIADGRGVSGLIEPGNLVDILVTITDEDESNQTSKPETRTVLQAVRVLATDDITTNPVRNKSAEEEDESDRAKAKRRAQQRRAKKPTVTLAVTPDDAEAVAHAAQEGTITLALRGSGPAIAVENLDSVNSNILAGVPLRQQNVSQPNVVRVQGSAAPAESFGTLQVIQGTSSTTLQVDSSGAIRK